MKNVTVCRFVLFLMTVLTGQVFAQEIDSADTPETLNAPALSSAITTKDIFLGRIANLEKELEGLKSQISASETSLMALKAQVDLSGGTEAKLIIHSKDETNGHYKLIESIYSIDGKEVARLKKEDAKVPVFSDLIPEGNHEIAVQELYERMERPISPDAQTFQLKNKISVTTVIGKTTFVDVVTVEKDKRAEEKLSIRFDVKSVPNEVKNAPVSVLEMPAIKQTDGKKEGNLRILVRQSSNPSLVLAKQILRIDQQDVQLIDPSLVTDKGQVIFDGALEPGKHEIHSLLVYDVSGDLAKTLKTKQIRLKFFDTISVRDAYKTTLLLKGYEKEATVVLPDEQTVGLTEITEELIREQQQAANIQKASNNG